MNVRNLAHDASQPWSASGPIDCISKTENAAACGGFLTSVKIEAVVCVVLALFLHSLLVIEPRVWSPPGTAVGLES